MNFSMLRDYAFLCQASYRALTTLPRHASAQQLEIALSDPDQNVLSPGNRFAAGQAEVLSGRATEADPTDGYAFLHQTPNGARGFSASVFASNDGQALPVGLRVVDRARVARRPASARRMRAAVRPTNTCVGAVRLQQRAKPFDGQTGIFDDAAHGERVDGVVSWDRQDPLSIAHHDVLALTHDPEAGLLKGAHRIQMVDAGEIGQG